MGSKRTNAERGSGGRQGGNRKDDSGARNRRGANHLTPWLTCQRKYVVTMVAKSRKPRKIRTKVFHIVRVSLVTTGFATRFIRFAAMLLRASAAGVTMPVRNIS